MVRRLYLAILGHRTLLATPLTGLVRRLRREGCQSYFYVRNTGIPFDACVLGPVDAFASFAPLSRW